MTIQMFHGLNAYIGKSNNIWSLIQKAEGLSNIGSTGGEICTADIPIGNIGIMVEGGLANLFYEDVWSSIDPEGKRNNSSYWDEFGNLHDNEVMYDSIRGDLKWALDGEEITQERVIVYCEKFATHAREKIRSNRQYSEGWMSPEVIHFVWVKHFADDREKKMARVLSRRLGVPLIEVRNSASLSAYTVDVCVEEESYPKWLEESLKFF